MSYVAEDTRRYSRSSIASIYPRSLYGKSYGDVSRTSLCSVLSQEDYHHARLGHYAATLWKHDAMTDVMVVVQNKEFKTHKAVLACYSPYFKEILMKPGSETVHYLEVPCVTPRAFEILLKYMYTGEIQLTCQELAEVYRAARNLGMHDALQKCRDLMKVSPHRIENSVYLFVTAKKLDLLEPSLRAFKLMTSHFETIIETKEFLDLNPEQVVDFFSAPALAARSELSVFLAALKWINYDFLRRESNISHVMGCVRYPLMQLSEVLLCYHPPLLPAIVLYPTVKEALSNGTCYVAAKHLGQELLFEPLSCPPRTYLLEDQPSITWDVEYLYDPDLYPEYRDNKAATKIQATFRSYLTRKRVSELFERRHSAAVKLQSAFRGYLARRSLVDENNFRYANERSRKAAQVESHNDWGGPTRDLQSSMAKDYADEGRSNVPATDEDYFSCTAPNANSATNFSQDSRRNVIYCIGGIDVGNNYMSSNAVLCYSPSENAWKDLGDVPEPRHDIRLAVLDGILYCIGGRATETKNGAKMVPRRECFKYDIGRQMWFKIAPLKYGRVFHGVAVVNSSIYVVGGKDDCSRILLSVEKYDPLIDEWMDSAPMTTPRMGMGVTAYDGAVWVVGGMTGHGSKLVLVNTVESFDPQNGRWHSEAKLPYAVAFMALVQCSGALFCIGGAYHESSDKRELISSTDVFVYDQENAFWRESVDMPIPCHSVIASDIGDSVYVLGGQSAQNLTWLNEVFVFCLPSRRWTSCCRLPSSASGRIIAAASASGDYDQRREN